MAGGCILVVEDDADILQLLSYNLRAAGFDVQTCVDGNGVMELIRTFSPDLVILDLMLPGVDGLEICRRLKQDSGLRSIPVIILTARGEEIDRIVGLELGADDYVVKPFSPRELILRIKAILRRSVSIPDRDAVLQSGGVRVDLDGYKVTVDGENVELTATEFRLMVELIRNPGKVLTRDQLLHHVWGYEFDGYARTVDTHIRRLRQKLGDYSAWIETVRGVGYRFSRGKSE